jgi:hypothetical protein
MDVHAAFEENGYPTNPAKIRLLAVPEASDGIEESVPYFRLKMLNYNDVTDLSKS